MRDSIRKTRRGSRRFVSLLATGVLLLAAWVLATNTVFGPADPEAVEPTAVIETATEFETAISKSRKADALERIASSSDETAMSEEKPAPVAELTHPVVVAGVAPSMGGTETLLSPALVSRSVEPATESADLLVPLPRTRPRLVAIPLPRPRPGFAESKLSGRTITEAEIQKHSTY
ncbi:MAG: hypothetical protein ACXWU8_04705 [Rhodoplanes sp.]